MSNLSERLRDEGHARVVCGGSGDLYFDAANALDFQDARIELLEAEIEDLRREIDGGGS